MNAVSEPERIETVVVGGGQAGLSVGYHLARQGRSFVILDANERIGDAWRKRWDSLRLFTPARFNGLDGLPFPGPRQSFSTKDEVADYLEAYAGRFALPVRTGVRVRCLSRSGDRFLLDAGDRRFEADNVVVAMGSHQLPRSPTYAASLRPEIVQLHACAYRNAAQLREGRVLVVGVGNSGAEIALDVAAAHPTLLAGNESGRVPFRPETLLARHVLLPLMFRVVGHRVLTVRTPVGRKLRPRMLAHAAPVVRVKPVDMAAAGIERVGRVVGTRDGLPSSMTNASFRWRTSSGARDSTRTSPGSTYRSSEPPSGRTSQFTYAGSCPTSQGCTSSGCTFSMQCRPDSFPAWAEMPSTLLNTSRRVVAESRSWGDDGCSARPATFRCRSLT